MIQIRSLLSIFLGLIAAKIIMGKNVIEHGPDSNIVRKEIHKSQVHPDICYKFEPVTYVCGVANKKFF